MANLTKETLTKMPSDQSFDHFYGNISRKSEVLLGKPTLPPVNPATSVAGERSFSSARHLKTWLLSRMGDLAVLNGHKRRTDSVSITTPFSAIRIAREASALRATSKSNSLSRFM